MYIFEITEIEQIILSYLDYCVDFSVLKQTNKKYKDIVNNNEIYGQLYKFSKSDTTQFKHRFIRACATNIFIAKYLFYKYTNIDIHHCAEDAFRSSCYNGHLDIAQWL